ncbi:hypothetical protein BpHYR1_038587 [Brachionus plicatilis]|uniref:Uncharacterized protein n=1 Tax=Brachionus plicatilis TaxID=10195 RepID=A0A3M7R510_BRAPC|nr:hypothetical protein BpHYR1_038587 [Brachionus plicatilis]
MPSYRSCEHVGTPLHYCVCYSRIKVLKVHDIMSQRAAKDVLNEINKLFTGLENYSSISAYNCSKKSSTNSDVNQQVDSQENYVNKLKKGLTERNECVRQNLEIARDRQKILMISLNKPGESKSFKQRAIGPLKNVKALGELNYSVMNLVDKKMQTVPYNRLLRFKHRDSNGFETLSLRQKKALTLMVILSQIFLIHSNLVSNVDPHQNEATFMCTVRLNHYEQVLDQSVVAQVQNEIKNDEQIRTDQNTAVESEQVNDEEIRITAGLEYTDAQSTDEEIEQVVDGQINTCGRSFKDQKGLSQHLRMSSCGQVVTMFS